jgi:hypothetical protein
MPADGEGEPMNGTLPYDGSPPPGGGAPRRVRHEVRDGAVVVVFSATASTTVALALLFLARLVG